MKFYKKATKFPVIGDIRTRTVFAWTPTQMSDGVITVWLERYDVDEQMMSTLSDTDPAQLSWYIIKRTPRYSLGW